MCPHALFSQAQSHMGSCTQVDTATVNLTEQVLHITVVVLVSLVNTLLIILIIQQRIYTTMALFLLLAAAIFSSIAYIVSLIYELMEFVWPTSNTMCIIFLLFIITAFHCSVLLVLEMFVVIAATFYKSFKNIPPKQKPFKEKFRMFLIFLTMAISISLLINIIRSLLFFLNDDILITDDGYCIPLSDSKEDPAAMYINTATVLAIVLATALASVFVLIVVLFCVLSKHNSVTVSDINRKLLKIAVILIGSIGINIIVLYTIAFSTNSDYNSLFALAMIFCERICILIIISRVKTETTHQATSNVENNCVISNNT